MEKQIYNPFLPLDEYIPDGEPHVFGDRVYLFGSHDMEGGHTFCMLDYAVYSAPVTDLKDWRFEGISYRASQDPRYPERPYMFAPDVVQGNDGRFYLYYCMAGEYGIGGYTEPISVAVSDTPAGPYEYLGHVRQSDGTPLRRYVCFDPCVMNDEGTIRICYGTRYDFEEQKDFPDNPKYLQDEMEMFGKSKEEILSYEDSVMGAITLTLADDMLTVKEPPRHILPYKVGGTSFEEHPFFEASSLRKFEGTYYFIYSSWQNHELCYATSPYPDHGFTFRGTLISNGDVGYQGRSYEDKLNMTGTTHGSIEKIGEDYYVFYHRLTHKSDYSRQACAEKLIRNSDGTFDQVPMTSCGLNGGPLAGRGTYPAVICCNLTNGNMPHGCNSVFTEAFPNVTHLGEQRFVAEIEEGTLLGYKYFDLSHTRGLSLRARMDTGDNHVSFTGPARTDQRSAQFSATGHTIKEPGIPSEEPKLEIRLTEEGPSIGEIDLKGLKEDWQDFSALLPFPEGIFPLYFVYHGKEPIQLLSFTLTE
ncbi:MAG: family 43 glycosylhydrolase [Lachnospiraceae bacterium]|nr:family 43 glycosylhydrolase [Lachnospiraceae bacterium]